MVYNTLGLVLQACGLYDTAMDRLLDAVTMNPDFVGAWENLARLQSALGRSGEAARSSQKAAELRVQSVNDYNEKGLLRVSQQRYAEAMEAFRAGILCNPSAFTLYHNLGNILTITGQTDQKHWKVSNELWSSKRTGQKPYSVAALRY